MVCAVIRGPTYASAHMQLREAAKEATLAELRLDGFEAGDLPALIKATSLPLIFTLRSVSQGGNYKESEAQRYKDLLSLASLQPAFLDVEYDTPLKVIEEIRGQFPKVKLIASYHDFAKTPVDFEEIYTQLKKLQADLYKIAVMAHSTLDALRLMAWVKATPKINLIALSMGPLGQLSRILASVLGAPFTYACLEEEVPIAPGQLSLKTLVERYHFSHLTTKTALYGLIGNPVDKSISDATHNSLFKKKSIDAVYVKMQITPGELPECLRLTKLLGFQGLSITTPLKEVVIPLLEAVDEEARKIGAVNTLKMQKEGWIGYNTDGRGALNALEKKIDVKNKSLLIIGAGGAAKAIAYEATKRGALVTILNRDEKKAGLLAQECHCTGKGLTQIEACTQQGYDILINCTPDELPFDPKYLLSSALVMDIKTRPQHTLLLQSALEQGCTVVLGERMFFEQAVLQFQLWGIPFSIDDFNNL